MTKLPLMCFTVYLLPHPHKRLGTVSPVCVMIMFAPMGPMHPPHTEQCRAAVIARAVLAWALCLRAAPQA